MAHGEKLIADVYNAVRNSRCWKNTLLIISYDEHGGCYDHVDESAPSLLEHLVSQRLTIMGRLVLSPTLVKPSPNALSTRAIAAPNGMQDSLIMGVREQRPLEPA